MLLQPRHQLDQITRPMPRIELPQQDVIPAVLYRAGTAWQRKQIGAACNTADSARLDSRRTDLLIAQHAEQLAKTLDALFQHTIGVTSRPVMPVPPVLMITSIAGSAIHSRKKFVIRSASSRSIARAATRWPASAMRAASVSPDVSSDVVRVSDTVSTAMFTAMKLRLSSMRPMIFPNAVTSDDHDSE
jgi:hypothetical protein